MNRNILIGLYHFLVPITVAGLYILILYLIFPTILFYKIGGILFLYLVPPAGKESMVPAMVYVLSDSYGVWCVILASIFISLVDVLVAWWVDWNWDLVKKIPLLGMYVIKLEKIGEKKWREHRILKKFVYAGLALFVAVPFQGSGGLTTMVIGRVLGLGEYKVILSIAIGALIGTLIIGFGAYYAIFTLGKNVFWVAGGIIILVLVIWILYRWITGEKK